MAGGKGGGGGGGAKGGGGSAGGKSSAGGKGPAGLPSKHPGMPSGGGRINAQPKS